MPRCLVFDFDGVLADSEPLHFEVLRDLLRDSGLDLTRAAYYERYLGFDDEGVFQHIAADHGLILGDEEIDLLLHEKMARFERLVGGRNVLYPGAAACVERVGRAFPLGIASGAMRRDIDLMLRAAGLQDRFRFIVSAEDTERSKPDPDPYARAAQLHGVEPGACVAIEDSRQGLQSARAAGLRTIAVTHTYPAGDLREADVVISSLDELTIELITSGLKT
ncbi:MAG TPA: HAD family phosphatase [Vicinamibacterales bacterium]|nr:HAD family phosphatase [Vicinamibacterales bacterium]